MLDLILNDDWEGGEDQTVDPAAACRWFLGHGLDDTLMSYGVDAGEIEEHRRHSDACLLAAIRESIPQSHRRFFRDLPVVIQEPGLFIAHADAAAGGDGSIVHLANVVASVEQIDRGLP